MKESLVTENINLIYYVLKKMDLHNPVGIDRYFDVGMIGLVKAANKYDPNKDCKFSSFAVKCIHNQILYQIRYENLPKRQPEQYTLSLDEVYENKNENDVTMLDLIPSDFDLEEDVIKREQLKILNEAIKTELDDKERLALKLYLDDWNQTDIGKEIKLQQASVSRCIQRIIKKLKRKVNN